jgi:glycosyltransferase involved in cell wall biosynthesis
MACGTPVIAWRNGSVPEVIEHGVTGFIIDSVEEGIEAVRRAGELDRGAIRRRFEERFTVERMASAYVSLYDAIRSRTSVAALAQIVA